MREFEHDSRRNEPKQGVGYVSSSIQYSVVQAQIQPEEVVMRNQAVINVEGWGTEA